MSAFDDYLWRLGASLELSARRRRRLVREVAAHLADDLDAERRSRPLDEAVAVVIARAGPPSEIVRAAHGHSAPAAPAPPTPRRLAPVHAVVRCGGEDHVVSWRRGRLVTICTAQGCRDVIEAWRSLDPLEALPMFARWLDPLFTTTDLGAERGGMRHVPSWLPDGLGGDVRWPRAVVSSLPLEMRRRYVAGALLSLERRSRLDGGATTLAALGPLLREAVSRTIAPALPGRRWLVEARFGAPSAHVRPSARYDVEILDVAVPVRWLRQAWARSSAVTPHGWFVLDAQDRVVLRWDGSVRAGWRPEVKRLA